MGCRKIEVARSLLPHAVPRKPGGQQQPYRGAGRNHLYRAAGGVTGTARCRHSLGQGAGLSSPAAAMLLSREGPAPGENKS